MFATLLLIRHVIDGGREASTLTPGETLASELMRLYPDGFSGPWDVYLREVRDENLIPKETHETEPIIEGERYYLVLRPGAAAIVPFLIKFAIALVVSMAVQVVTKMLTPKPKQADSNAMTEAMSPNNQLAGQTNVLRPGARVPEILGKMRCYPDMIANAQESWIGSVQWLVEWFVLGVGSYKIENAKLGETALRGLSGAQLVTYSPGMLVPPILCVKKSPLVDSVSLLTESATVNAESTTFTPPAQMSSTLKLPISLGPYGTPVRIGNTANNNALFDVRQVPAAGQTTAPFVYSLYGPVRTETAVAAVVAPLPAFLFIQYAQLTWSTALPGDIVIPASQGYAPVVGQVVRLFFTRSGNHYVGTVVGVTDQTADLAQYRFWLDDLNGNRVVIPGTASATPTLIVYEDSGSIYTGLMGDLPRDDEIVSPERVRDLFGPRATSTTLYTVWTDWQTAPFSDPQQLLLDFAFPSGLARYYQGNKQSYTVQVQAQFRRLGASTTATRTWTYTNSTQTPQRFTESVAVADLGLPAGSPYIQTRVIRVTPWTADDNDNQYIGDTRWQVYSAAVEVAAQVYSNVTLLCLTLWNTRSAASIGETSLNVIATRVLPTWLGPASEWSGPVPTERWADALVSRMKAFDGANKQDADIDLAGIYAIQARLDALDGGDQGKIAVTLDQQQDIDSELQSIASITRCQLYRIGPKLYCERDESGKSAIALFTGRSKHPDAETVSISLSSDADPDAVIVPWWDRTIDAWKQREYQFPENVTPVNPLRLAPAQATWAQACRRAWYEWNRLTLRRETLTLKATEEAALVHPGDVVNVADDVGNLSQTAGEVIEVQALHLILDQDLDLRQGSWLIMLRSLDGRATDVIRIIPYEVPSRHVWLERSPRFAIKGRDDGLGTMYALYNAASTAVIPWLVSSVEPEDRYLTISAVSWVDAVFAGDFWPLPGIPIAPFAAAEHMAHPQTIGAISDEELAGEAAAEPAR